MTTFERIKQIATEEGYTLREVASKSGLSENAIYRYNQGIKPKYDSLKAIANTLNVSVEYLSGETTERKRPKEIDLKEAFEDDYTLLSWQGMEITDEEKEMIRRILNGGK
ncbi:helix-turn-helix domain-containing protein [Lactobacillus terrae]|uniref:helix-turn-helix domain-containing protein n=1 Tax=Lactobacillus terrae TaxID=2269374 RepID=UPI000C1B65CF|nr:helix-turn-helix transcriptional regulator [Lactobacillus terrae]